MGNGHRSHPSTSRARERNAARKNLHKLGVEDPTEVQIQQELARRTDSAEADIARTFAQVVETIRNEMRRNLRGDVVRTAHNAAVDVELEFRSVEVQSRGLFFRKDVKDSSVSLKLATRILPEE